MEYKPDLDNVIKRYQAFWQKDLHDHPPIRVRYPIPGQSDEEWCQAFQAPETYFDYHENILKHRVDLHDDALPTAAIDMAPGMWGGIMGCEVRFGHGTSWSKHELTDWNDMDRFLDMRADESNPWVRRMLDLVEYFTEKSAGKCLVGMPLPMGPGDMVTALRGPTEICLDIYLNPEQLQVMLEACTKLWIEFFQLMFDRIPSYQGGYADDYDIWTPGRTSYFADDVTSIISDQSYLDTFFKHDCKVADSLETPWMHIHSEQARLIPEFVKIPGLRGIQVVNDFPAGPSLKSIVPQLKQVQKEHCLILRKYTIEELEEILGDLSPEGLLIDTHCDSKEQAKVTLQKWIERVW